MSRFYRVCVCTTDCRIITKIQASGQRKDAFMQAQKDQGFERTLVIPLHGNTRWGSAHGMCARAWELRQVTFLLLILQYDLTALCRLLTCLLPPRIANLDQLRRFDKTARFGRRYAGQHSSLKTPNGTECFCARKSLR